jgi:hypothetical protein
MEKWQLFHQIADKDSAAARKFVTERSLEGRIQFRNTFYEEVVADLKAHGGTAAPALWDGKVLSQGLEAVLKRLGELTG